MDGRSIVLFVTLGFMLICFVIWLWQSIFKRRKLEDQIEEEKEAIKNGTAEPVDTEEKGKSQSGGNGKSV